MIPCTIRFAVTQDAPFAVAVLRSSITQLCVADHQNNAATLERWLRNKTPEQFLRWLADPQNCVVVAEIESVLCGVGLIRTSGDLDLCYVQPGWQGAGIGRALLSALEAQARNWNLLQIRLISTVTARTSYERHGYLFTKQEWTPRFGLLQDYHYTKFLDVKMASA